MTASLAQFVDAHGRALVLIFLSLACAGLLFTFRLPISLFPETDFPRIVILVDNGIQPVDVQMLTVTRPLEEAIRSVPGITDVRSVTGRGSSEISVIFRWDVDILNALHLMQGKIAQIEPSLPPGTRFDINRLTFFAFPMLGFSLTSPKRSQAELYDLAYNQIAPRLFRLSGVAEARITGGKPPEYHVLVEPEKLNSYGIPLTKVADAIRKTNLIGAGGLVEENYKLYLTTVTGQLKSKEQIEDVVVDVVKGTPVYIKNLARVVNGERPNYVVVTADGRPATLVNVHSQPDGNVVETAAAVNRELDDIRKTLPPDIQLGIFYDQSFNVRDSISSVTDSILIGLGLAIVVLIGFLKSWRTTLVAGLVIPIAVLIAIIFMKLFNMSFNVMTLGGIAACIGVVIDDAIVMVENIIVHLSLGQPPRAAARSAIIELTPALIGSTLTPIVVFVPLIFLGGITAIFFRALALSLVTALLASLFLAIFLTPVLARLFFKARTVQAASNIEEAEQAGEGRIMRGLTARYEKALQWSLAHAGLMVLASLGVLAASVFIYFQLGSGFLPEVDEGAFVLDYKMPAGTSLTETDRVLRHVEEFLKEAPEVAGYSRRTGAELGPLITEPNTGDFLVRLKRDRKRESEEVIEEVRDKIKEKEPVLEFEFIHIIEDMIGDLAQTPQPIEIKVFHPDDKVYREVAGQIAEWLEKKSVRGVVDVEDRTTAIGPAHNFRVNLEKAALAGFSAQDVLDLQAGILDGEVASNVIRDNRLIPIRVRYPAEYRSTNDKLKSLLLTSPSGHSVPLASIADVETEETSYEIRRDNLRNFSSVTAQLEGRDLVSAMDEIKLRLAKEVPLPPGTQIEYGGLYVIQQESFRGLTMVLLGSILLIFIILVFEFRSFSHPIAILIATILCGFGALLALWLTKQTLNISSFMGAIMVIGIVHKNGILMLDSEQHFTAQGLELRDAIYYAARRRLRPILMTALATIFGMLPLAVGIGSGSQLLQPLAIAVIGGVTVSLALSLLVTPVLFYLLRKRGL
ncbi:MAG: efflux RND transporter permease subunit [Acidobacteria bacterium]|nr:efflux RND transporter permease subunit [Acidobacteriota bacterium]MBI3425112.1 efflux RND transporter permease subunit [Acidobacteriota bacterium]